MASLSPREELLRLQKRIYRQNKSKIADSVIPEDPSFQSYEKRYLRSVSRYQQTSLPEELLEEVLKASLIFVGDYHTLNQSQKSFLRILREVITHTDNSVLGLELLQARHQPELNKYLKGKISDETFLKKIEFREHWLFDLWENFRPIFDFARYHHIPIYGIEAPPQVATSLKERDREMARLIYEIHQKGPDKKIFIFVGDLHLAPPHLPQETLKIFKKNKVNPKILILYQNSDSIYWQLAKDELEDKVTVVRLSENELCRMHTPPIICQQSFLNWLEQEEGVFDFADAKQSFLNYLDRIAEFLDIKLGKEKEEVEVFTCGDLSFLKKLRESKVFTSKEIREIKRQILRSESYYIAKKKYIYLADVSVNHAAEEASHTLRHLCAGDEFPRTMQDAFYANIIHEALGFFGSKIINHRRKCFRPADFKKLLAYLEKSHLAKERELEYMTAKLFLEHEAKAKKGEPFHFNKITPLSTDLFLSLTHAIAYYLGEKMFYGLLDELITKKYIHDLYYDPFAEEGETVWKYFEILNKIKEVKLPQKV